MAVWLYPREARVMAQLAAVHLAPHSQSGRRMSFPGVLQDFPRRLPSHAPGRIMCSRLADSAGGLILPVVCVAGLCGLRPVWSAAAVDEQEFPRSLRSFPQELPRRHHAALPIHG